MKFEFENQCDKEWDEMKGGDKRRYCDSCDKHVHHLSGMTKEQALKFLNDRDWDVCVDFFTDAEGNTEFREPQRRLAMQLEGVKQLLAGALAVVPLALAAAFIDFDQEEAVEVVSVTANPPLSLAGPSPVIVNTTSTFDFEPIQQPVQPSVEIPEPVVVFEIPEPAVVEEVPEPVIEQQPEPEIKPVPLPRRPHLRGKIKRPLDPDLIF